MPVTIIRTQMVVATLAPPIHAANLWTSVAIGPYTDGCFFHTDPTAAVYAVSPQACGLVVYGFPPCAAMRPYAAWLPVPDEPIGVRQTMTATTAVLARNRWR